MIDLDLIQGYMCMLEPKTSGVIFLQLVPFSNSYYIFWMCVCVVFFWGGGGEYKSYTPYCKQSFNVSLINLDFSFDLQGNAIR